MIKTHGIKMQIFLHTSAWAILLGIPIFFFYRWDVPEGFIWAFYIFSLINAVIFYSNYLLLIPKMFFKERKLRYFLAAILLAVALFFVSVVAGRLTFETAPENGRPNHTNHESIENRENPGPDNRNRRIFRQPFGPMHVYNFAFNAIAFTVFAMGLRVMERNAQIEKRQKELEKEKLNSELAFLKNQISPHFFFNTMNNIYSLISINKEDSQNAVLKLSRMMRYLLYESEQGETKLSSEIDFMGNYIDLMKLRVSEKVKLNVVFPVKYEDITMPPLLFISIIENAFKYGISYREKSFIDIEMNVSKEMINFRCANSIVQTGEDSSAEKSGIGLENLKKRLKLLFPEKHEFVIDQSGSTFHVLVKIFLT